MFHEISFHCLRPKVYSLREFTSMKSLVNCCVDGGLSSQYYVRHQQIRYVSWLMRLMQLWVLIINESCLGFVVIHNGGIVRVFNIWYCLLETQIAANEREEDQPLQAALRPKVANPLMNNAIFGLLSQKSALNCMTVLGKIPPGTSVDIPNKLLCDFPRIVHILRSISAPISFPWVETLHAKLGNPQSDPQGCHLWPRVPFVLIWHPFPSTPTSTHGRTSFLSVCSTLIYVCRLLTYFSCSLTAVPYHLILPDESNSFSPGHQSSSVDLCPAFALPGFAVPCSSLVVIVFFFSQNPCLEFQSALDSLFMAGDHNSPRFIFLPLRLLILDWSQLMPVMLRGLLLDLQFRK